MEKAIIQIITVTFCALLFQYILVLIFVIIPYLIKKDLSTDSFPLFPTLGAMRRAIRIVIFREIRVSLEAIRDLLLNFFFAEDDFGYYHLTWVEKLKGILLHCLRILWYLNRLIYLHTH